MQKKLSPNALKRHYQKHLAKTVHSFMVQALDKDIDEVKKIYQSFCDNWYATVDKVNSRYGKFVLAHESWRNIYERDGYKNIIFLPVTKEEKSALLRIVYIVENKTEKQRERRELKFKFYFVFFKVKKWFKSLWK